MEKELIHKELLESLSYDRDTGVFTWKSSRPLKHFKTESARKTYLTKFAGKTAGHMLYMKKEDKTYIQIRLFTKLYLAHRLAWFYETGEWPEDLIDHLNGDGSDNSFINLREATKVINGRNCALSKNNSSGINGVYFNKANNTWVAEGHYTESGIHKKKSLGSYKDIEDARKARITWEESQGNFTKRHGKSQESVV